MISESPPRRIFTGIFEATPKVRQYIQEVLDSGRISYGDKSRKFERLFARTHDATYGILSNSGTSSLHVALQTLKELHGWQRGDEVIVPATTFVATSNIVKHNDMTPVFVDVHSQYYNIDPSKIEEKITDRTRAIIPVHLFGQPADMSIIMEIANVNGLFVIEDSCETMFVKHADQPVGSMGHIGCFSMYVAHLITAGVGGIAITDNPHYASKMRSLVNHGLRQEDLNLDEYMSPQPMLNRKFVFDAMGHSFRITEFEAAVALAQLENYEEEILKPRQKLGKRFTEGIIAINYPKRRIYQSVKVMPDNETANMMYPIVLHKQNGEYVDKKPLTDYLNQHGIETRDMLPLLDQPIYRYVSRKNFPVSAWLVDSGFYVGCHQGMTIEDVNYILDKLLNYVEEKEYYDN